MVLTLTIGPMSAVLALANREAQALLPFREPDRLVRVWETRHGDPLDRHPASPGSLQEWKQRATLHFARFAGFTVGTSAAALRVVDQTRSASIAWSTPDLFPLLGTYPECGRSFAPDESSRSLILRHQIALNLFGSSCAAIGRPIDLEGRPYEVVGVLPPRFDLADGVDVWLPLHLGSSIGSRESAIHSIDVIARLRHGSSIESARNELQSLQRSLDIERHAHDGHWSAVVSSLGETASGASTATLHLLCVALFFMLLLGCSNVAAIQASVLASRGHEFAVRQALGARQIDVWAQVINESLAFSVLGGLLALPLGVSLARIMGVWLNSRQAIASVPEVDGHVCLVALFLTISATLVSCTVSSWRVRPDGRMAQQRVTQRRLVQLQAAISVCLLVVTGTAVRSYLRLRAQPLGFTPAGVTTVDVRLPLFKYHQNAPSSFVHLADAILQEAALGGDAGSVALSTAPPFSGRALRVTVRGTNGIEAQWSAQAQRVSFSYFQVLNIHVQDGRAFVSADVAEGDAVVIVNRRLAEMLSSSSSIIGTIVSLEPDSVHFRRVVGVVADVLSAGDNAPVPPEVYVPYAQAPLAWFTLCVRSAEGGSQLAGLRQRLLQIEPWMIIDRPQSLESVLDDGFLRSRRHATFLALLAIVALVIGSAGIYGMVSAQVVEQRLAVGIRKALGLTPIQALSRQIANTIHSLTVGAAVGVLVGAVLGRALGSLLFGYQTYDVVALLGAPALVLFVGALASATGARSLLSEDLAALLRRD